ncbi:MAG: tRNA pseudouridine(38-40) synthase TruA [Roseburia sp.]|nr:tRNA pseudouridine(38-40) synthase TruA [Roseburia sp.]
MRYKLTLGYDGTGFCGWQSQPNGESVQDALERAAFKLLGERVRMVGSGRTDAGVHALRQVAHFDCVKALPPERITGGLNAYLPSAVRVSDAAVVPNDFDARKDVKKKTYMYLMYRGARQPVLENRAWHIGDDIDVGAMSDAVSPIVGTHDFATFMASGSGAKTSVRTVFDARFTRDGDFIKFFITADGFLYNMVRIIVAQAEKCGKGAHVDFDALLRAKSRDAAKEIAPPYGLYLYDVEYAGERAQAEAETK